MYLKKMAALYHIKPNNSIGLPWLSGFFAEFKRQAADADIKQWREQ